jgi:hypothetical protein
LFSLSYLFACLNHYRDSPAWQSAIQTIASAQTHVAFPVILRMDKAKHGEASYLQFISDAKYNRAESDAGRRKSCGQSRRDHNTLNRDEFLDENISDLMIYSSILLNGCAVK